MIEEENTEDRMLSRKVRTKKKENVVYENFTISNFPSKNTIEQTNAIIYGRVDKNVNSTVSKIGVKVWKDGTLAEQGTYTYENR